MFFDASFLYWQAAQENMELGILNKTSYDGIKYPNGIHGTVINMNFDYKAGFKVGGGGYFDHDNWEIHAEYSWFHSLQHKKASTSGIQEILPSWGHPYVEYLYVFKQAKEKWKLSMDIGELELARSYYVGTDLLFRPSFGFRAAGIRQHVRIDYQRPGSIVGPPADHGVIYDQIKSWAVGPQVELTANWQVGSGFRLFGCVETDLLYTKYTTLLYNETHTDVTVPNSPVHLKQPSMFALRSHIDLDFGVGWSTPVDCHTWHLDFALGYEFQVFFDQNMFRHFTDNGNVGNTNSPNGNLYIQGLTATFKLDF
jgi:hypothetical protein